MIVNNIPLTVGKDLYGQKMANALVCILLIFFMLVLHIPVSHPPGSGLFLPTNITAWVFMAAVCFIVCLKGFRAKTSSISLAISPLTRQAGIATLMLAVPLLYTPESWRMDGFLQWLGIAGGFIFYICLTQVTFRPVHYRLLLTGLAGAALIQAIIGALFLLIWLPEPGEWYAFGPGVSGILLQKNIAATFMTVGLGAALLLWLEPVWRGKGFDSVLLLLALFVISFMQVFLESRIGVVNGLVLIAVLSFLYWRHEQQRLVMALTSILTGVVLGNLLIWLAPAGHLDLLHEASTRYRMQMLLETAKMIAQHPLLGWGLGSFSYHYAHFLIDSGTESLESAVVLHPHNEWLFGWAEGGIVTVVAYLTSLAAGWKLWRCARRKDRSQGVVYRRALWMLLLPLLLHTQVEYPFYLSAVLWMVFLLLLALQNNISYGDHLSDSRRQSQVQYSGRVIQLSYLLVCIGSLLTLGFMSTGLQSGLVLTSLEQTQTTHPMDEVAQIDLSGVKKMQWNPWIFKERFEFDGALNHLLSFNSTRDPQLLVNYLQWSSEYLTTHVQPDVFASRMTILKALGSEEQAEWIRSNAHLLYPKDMRFMSGGQ